MEIKRVEQGHWAPGQSGNPAGKKPGGRSLSEILRDRLDKEKYITKLLEMAYDGYFPALKEVYERLEGKVSIPLSGADGEPLIITIQALKKAEQLEDDNEYITDQSSQ